MDYTADELHQIAQSLAIDGSLGRSDALVVIEVLQWAAARGWEREYD